VAGGGGGPQYAPSAEFQSHTAEFDYLKSLEIEEKINQIKWCRPCNNAQYLLSTNDKTVKLWKVHERNVRAVTQYSVQAVQHARAASARVSAQLLRLPQSAIRRRIVASTPKRVYANAHTYHINSIALNSDGETFMSADDLRVNLWSLGISNQSFSAAAPLQHRLLYSTRANTGCLCRVCVHGQTSWTSSRRTWPS
jgi:serine/threonine-protein phosphatase 2A regulatory subunit B